MIAVIADDFTGAAEIGGIGLHYGLKVVIDTKVDEAVETDLLVIATDSRSQEVRRAAELVKQTTAALLALRPEFIFKKIDSLLRGNVVEELLAQLSAAGKARALVAPANPDLKRTIRNGIYYYDGVPLSEWEYGSETGNKPASSFVMDLVGEKAATYAGVVSVGEAFPGKKLLIGNADRFSDLEHWAERIDEQTIPAGGAGFFRAILQRIKRVPVNTAGPVQLGEKALYVCGSAFPGSRELVKRAKAEGRAVIDMPEKLFCAEEDGPALFRKWAGEIVGALEKKGKVILAVGDPDCGEVENLPSKIREAIAEVVEMVFQRVPVGELMIEGGATAFSVIQRLGYTTFHPTDELGPGTVRMEIVGKKGFFLTLKPGSYAWPGPVWEHSRPRQAT